MNNSQVAHNWAHGRRGKGSHFESDGVTLTSYWTYIAAKIDDIIYMADHSMSSSTSKHLSCARQAVNHERGNIFYTPAFQYGHRPTISHRAMIVPAVEHAIRTLETALSQLRTRKATKEAAIHSYIQRREEIINLAARVGVEIPDFPQIDTTPEAIAEYQEQKRIAAERKEAARVAAVQKQQQEDKEQFKVWLTTGSGRCPTSYQGRPAFVESEKARTDYITIKGETVVTSQGAEAPLDHVIKALTFYDSREIKPTYPGTTLGARFFKEYQTNGHKVHLGIFTLDSIDEFGNVKAGCHCFTAAEIARFRAQWAEVLNV